MQCDLCKTNEATNHGTTVINGQMTVEDLCPSCFASKHPGMNATLKRPWICDYCGGEAQSYESPLDMILAHKFPMKQEFICKSCSADINNKIETAMAVIKEMAKDETTTNQLVLEAVEATYQAARRGRMENDG